MLSTVQAVRRSKEKFFSTMASKVTTPRDFWKAYHSITKVHALLPNNMFLGVSSSAGKAELFNNFFASCFNPPSSCPPVEVSSSLPRLSELDVNGLDVLHAVTRLKPDTSSGPDGISVRMLKCCSSSISDHLAALFNSSLSSGIVLAD